MHKVDCKKINIIFPRLLTNYEYVEGAFMATTSIRDAAVNAGHVVNLVTLGMYIKRIWNGKVKKEYLREKDQYFYKNLGKLSPSNEERLIVINEQTLSTINQFLQLKHQSWFIGTKSFEKQCIILMKTDNQIDSTRIDGQSMAFKISIYLLPHPEIMFSTHRGDISMKRSMDVEDIELNLSAIRAAICFLEAATPCFGQPISPEDTNDHYKTSVFNSKIVLVTNQTVEPQTEKEHIVSQSCSLLSISAPNQTTSISSCQECSYVFRLFKKKMRKRRNSNSYQQAPHPKCNERFLARKGLEEKMNVIKTNVKKKALRLKEEDSVELVDEDHADLLEVVKKIDETSLPPQMKLLWTAQMKQLSKKSSKGYRWDPRYFITVYTVNYTTHVLV